MINAGELYQRFSVSLPFYKLSLSFFCFLKLRNSDKCRFHFPTPNYVNHHFEIKLYSLCLKHKGQILSSNTPPTLEQQNLALKSH